MPRKLTTKEFISKAKMIHGDKYDYSETDYIGSKIKSKIICKKHGIFNQIPNLHLMGKGCKQCGIDKIPIWKKSNTKKFVLKSKEIHGNKFDYSKVNYKKCNTKIIIICRKHGEFTQTPTNHLRTNGCPKCSGCIKVSTEIFIRNANKIHNNRYDYSKVNYINNRTKIKIICKKHGIFSQLPNDHLGNHGCPSCNYHVSKSEKSFLDYLKIKNRQIKLFGFKTDGFDPKTNTIYEFLGDYWHGNPELYDLNDTNNSCKNTFGKLNANTFDRFRKFKSLGYNIIYIWENDWMKFTRGIDKIPKILTY